ncbi:alpha/beta hydrolase [Teredinibacter franksiae]|uniref:alpha/beta hydrolase n=1 Tax=Teredinibacter franksiae TaxID=2761453 RepID=UPI00162397A7|nr:alpha/beta hydrolase [Teredinibacter franksiae]
MDVRNWHSLRSILVCTSALLFSSLCCAAAAAWPAFPNVVYTDPEHTSTIGDIQFTECRVSYPGKSHFRFLDCGSLEVPENYAKPSGKKITLFVGKIKAKGKKPMEDAFVPISGGPGSAASEGYLFPGQGFDKINLNRDIYIIDQRGTGKSNKLICLDDVDKNLHAHEQNREKTKQLVGQCLEELEGDPSQYTTSVAVRDLEAVRLALGLGAWNLYGASYGTRVAQHYLRMYPESTRSVILDAVAYPQLNLGYDIAIQSQRALDDMITRCEKVESCKQAFPQLKQGITSLFEQLNENPIELKVENFGSGKPEAFTLYKTHLLMLIRMSLYAPEVMAVLPLLLHEAYANNNFSPLARSAFKTEKTMGDMLSIGMHNSVVCSEDMAFFALRDGDRQRLAGTYIGEHLLDTLLDTCAIWPTGPVDRNFKLPVESNKPVLLLSGSADPITPPEYAVKAAEKLTNSRHLIAEGMGHGLAAKGCMPTQMAKFLDAASSKELDIECLDRLEPAPFFIDFNGPTP